MKSQFTSALKAPARKITGGLFMALFCLVVQGQSAPSEVLVPQWGKYEAALTSSVQYGNPFQAAELSVELRSPRGETNKVPGFWDGDRTWKFRFSPNAPGAWTWRTACSDTKNQGLHGVAGGFTCTEAKNGQGSRFEQHGPVRISPDGRYFMHNDRTPFFWLGDTAWNGPLKATDADWDFYLATRAAQKFTAVQWVTTQWRAAPDGNLEKVPAYTGKEKINVNPDFFKKLDERVDAMNRAGLLSVPVLLWAIQGGSNPQVNPGVSLPEDQAARLARYMVARWQANAVIWILNGDGDYRGDKAEKWRRIGRLVFGDIAHAPVTCHPGGRMWVWNEFINESWYDFYGYQSAHSENPDNLRWITSGPASQDWRKPPTKPFISLEAPYENHYGGNKQVMGDFVVRRAHYWSLLNAPTAGIVYGGHGIWGWDDGTRTPVDHPGSGIPLPWRKALFMPGATNMTVLANLFQSLEFWRLEPAQDVLAVQPGAAEPKRFVTAAKSTKNDLMVIYVPEDRVVEVKLSALTAMAGSPNLNWLNPRTGERKPAVALVTATACQIPTPDVGDWVLLVTAGK